MNIETNALVAGRELDETIAEKVLMEEPHFYGLDQVWNWPDGVIRTSPPRYSTDIAAAWHVLDAMLYRVGTANIRLDMEDYGRGAFSRSGPERAVWVTIGEYTAFGPVPLAICRAALAAVEASQ